MEKRREHKAGRAQFKASEGVQTRVVVCQTPERVERKIGC
jgi:hypothetical protein